MFNMETIEDIPMTNVPYFNQEKWVSPINYETVIRKKFPEKVMIYDVTLRDGEQTPGVTWKEDERVMIAQELSEMGINKIEVGMPIVSKHIVSAIKKLLNRNLKAELIALCRAKKDDIDLCLDIGLKSVVIEHPINPYLCRYALDIDIPELLDRIVNTISYAKNQGLHTNFFGWDALRTSIPYLQKIYSTVVERARPDSVTLTDTFGVALPDSVGLTISKLKEVIPNTPIEFHGHNEFGMGVAAALAAIENGATCIHSSINGLGERTGNIPTEEIVAALELLLNISTGVKLKHLYRISQIVSEISKVPIPPNKPIIGHRLFDVESGLVTDIIRKMDSLGIHTAMSPFLPSVVGEKDIRYVLGTGSGKANIENYLEKYKITASKEQRKEILDLIKEESYIRKSLLSEKDFLRIVSRVLSK